MKSLEEKNTKKKKSSHFNESLNNKKEDIQQADNTDKIEENMSESIPGPKNIALKPYEFNLNDLEAFAKKYDSIDPTVDIKLAKKARTEIKNKINEIKKIHLNNKSMILKFKKDVEAYDLAKFNTVTSSLTDAFNRINNAIENVESAKILREQEIEKKINSLENEILNDIINATNKEEINSVQLKIQKIKLDSSEYDNRVNDVSSLKNSLILKSAARAKEINNAGGDISKENIESTKTIKSNELNEDNLNKKTSVRFTDTELLDKIQSLASKKGWAVMINPNTGIQIYQIDDPNAPKDIRIAIEEALIKNNSI